MMTINKSCLVIIDVQEKLAQVMREKDLLFKNLEILIRGAMTLEIPVIWMEQIPEKIGPTIASIKTLLKNQSPIPKTCFSCCASDDFMKQLESIGKKQVILCGIETHVCVSQTALELDFLGYKPYVIADATSSRKESSKQIALERLRSSGITVTSVESALFELLKNADHPAFRQILKLVK